MKRDKINLDKLHVILKVYASSIDDRSLFFDGKLTRNVFAKFVSAVHIKPSIIKKQYIQLCVILSHKRIQCCKSWFSSRGKDSWNNIRSSILVQWNNNVVIWTDIPLFTSPFYRESYCLKTVLVVYKTHGFVVYSVTHRMRPPPKKSCQLFIWVLALSREGYNARFVVNVWYTYCVVYIW